MTQPLNLAQWREQVFDAAKKHAKLRQSQYETSSHIPLEPVYATPSDTDLPGQYPYTRGIHPTMYLQRLWTMRQYAGFGDAAQSNARYRYLLAAGQTGLSVAFDLPTQMGFDSDSPRAAGEVGKVGVAIDALPDMETLLRDLPLNQISTSMTINATASILLCLYLACAKRADVPFSQLRGTIQNDILKEYIARGTYIYPPRPSMRLVTDTFSFCEAHVPKWNTISISGYHIREAGANAAQEIAYTLADGLAYVEAALQAGLKVDQFAPRLAFFFNVHNNFFEEVAKFRAARRLWANLMRERFDTSDPRSSMLRFHAQTAGSTLTAQQPDNNVVRVALQALAAVCGGTQSLHTNALDEALSLPSEKAARLALRTQQVIAAETGVADVADPLGGSHLVEALTDALYDKARQMIVDIDNRGGMVAAIEQGYPQSCIEEEAYQTYLATQRGDMQVVGVNVFTEAAADVAKDATTRQDSEAVAAEQIRRIQQMRLCRPRQPYQAALSDLERAARSTDNLVPKIFAAVEAMCTVGEISDVLRKVFGVHAQG